LAQDAQGSISFHKIKYQRRKTSQCGYQAHQRGLWRQPLIEHKKGMTMRKRKLLPITQKRKVNQQASKAPRGSEQL